MPVIATGFTDLRCDYYRCYGHGAGVTGLSTRPYEIYMP